MTHNDMSQSDKSYFRARRYDPFPGHTHTPRSTLAPTHTSTAHTRTFFFLNKGSQSQDKSMVSVPPSPSPPPPKKKGGLRYFLRRDRTSGENWETCNNNTVAANISRIQCCCCQRVSLLPMEHRC